MHEEDIWSVFEVEKFDPEKKIWIKEHYFMMGDIRNTYDINDSRWCEVKGKRKVATLLGKGVIKFPVQYPIILDDGKIIEQV